MNFAKMKCGRERRGRGVPSLSDPRYAGGRDALIRDVYWVTKTLWGTE